MNGFQSKHFDVSQTVTATSGEGCVMGKLVKSIAADIQSSPSLSCLYFNSDATYLNGTRSSYVYMLTTNDHNSSTDEPDCLIQPEKSKCRTLAFILTNILMKKMLWIDTIYMENHSTTEPEHIILTEKNPTERKSITITCSQHCVLTVHLNFSSHIFNRFLVVQLENVTLKNSRMWVQNMHMRFVAVLFVDTVITDGPTPNNQYGEIDLHFSNSTFEAKTTQNTTFGLILDNTFAASISFAQSVMINTTTHVNISNLWFMSSHTSYKSSQVGLYIDTFCSSAFQTVQFTDHTEELVLEVTAAKLKLAIVESVFKRNTGGLSLTKANSGMLDSWMQVAITNCTFQNNSKLGSGGAILVHFYPPDRRLSDTNRSFDNFVEIKGSKFVGNKVQRQGFETAFGGALKFQSTFSSDENHCGLLHVTVENNTFINNQAEDGGGAIDISAMCIDTALSSCFFSVTEKSHDSPKGTFIFSRSSISVEKSGFEREIKGDSPSLMELQMLSPTAEIRQLSMDVKCHAWSNLESETGLGVSPTNGQSILQEAIVTCTSCPASYYIPSEGNFIVSYSAFEANFSVQDSGTNSSDLQCIDCPSGAECPGDDLYSKPNFWGFTTDEGIGFQQCPSEYCCTDVPCSVYNQCIGNRAGTLCGACQEGYSLSMLSHFCIENTKCRDHWLWILVVLAILIYMLWYTFKNDVFEIPILIASKLCKRSSTDDEVHYIDKGYFGIVTYFVQATAVMRLSLSSNIFRTVDFIFSQIESYIGLGLSIEISYIDQDICAVRDLTTTDKVMYKLLFLLGIYCSWILFYLTFELVGLFIGRRKLGNFQHLQIKLIYGLVEIIKYTYLGLTYVVFFSVVCTSIAQSQVLFGVTAETKVWFYDGSVQCFS